jgi:hypothetical protein
VYVRGREWVLARLHAQPRELQQSRP